MISPSWWWRLYDQQLKEPPKAKVDQTAYRKAMREQRKIKPEDFPIDNRAARRRAAKGKQPGEE